MKRGTLYWVNLEPSHPPEFGKTRPGLIVSNTEQNLHLPTVAMLPISTKPPEIWPLRLKIKTSDLKQSFVVMPGIRQVNKARLQEKIGELDPEDLNNMTEALFAYLND
ncbi:MAG: type II toxin-antitoxin system PemK/MazF family toxin [Deltaproteobacteria bacterium]|nr:type II toxin-antitoxin system PemK/MazF family toxin [Deltaproteobacteria bacterium]